MAAVEWLFWWLFRDSPASARYNGQQYPGFPDLTMDWLVGGSSGSAYSTVFGTI